MISSRDCRLIVHGLLMFSDGHLLLNHHLKRKPLNTLTLGGLAQALIQRLHHCRVAVALLRGFDAEVAAAAVRPLAVT